MAMRVRGTSCKSLLPRLPRNLVVFDGHCLMSQARVRYVLERNFNYFRMLPYFLGDEGDMAEQLDRHRMHFLSLSTSEADELKRLFLPKLAAGPLPGTSTGPTRRDSPGAAGSGAGGCSDEDVDLALIFVEKVPSKAVSFLMGRRARATSSGTSPSAVTGHTTRRSRAATDELFDNPTTVDDSYASLRGGTVVKKKNPVNTSASTMSTSAMRDPEDVDLLVSVNFAAMCRIGMHLDRPLMRTVCRAAYFCVPRPVGDWWFRTYVSERRKTIWGTSEHDAVKQLGIIEGMKERRWSWRTRYPS